MENHINKTLSIDVKNLKDEPVGSILDLLLEQARSEDWTPKEVSVLFQALTLEGTNEGFWKVVNQYTSSPIEVEEKVRYVRYAFCDLILPESEEPPKYIGIFDKEENKMGEVQCYFVSYEEEE